MAERVATAGSMVQDVSRGQRQSGDSDIDKQRFWTQLLDGASSATFPELPKARDSVSASQSIEAGCRDINCVGLDTDLLPIMSRAAWVVVQAAYTNNPDVIFGSRTRRSKFTTHPIRVYLDRQETVAQLLQRVMKLSYEIDLHADVGIETIHRASEDAEQACQFQTVVLFRSEQTGQHLTVDLVDSCSMPYANVIECISSGGWVNIRLTHDRRIVTDQQAASVLSCFHTVFCQLMQTKNNNEQVGSLELVGAEDMQKIWTWNADVPDAASQCVHDMIMAKALQQPDAPAVCASDGELSYGQLSQLSSQLAGHLITLGLHGPMVVPILSEKSVWVPVAILAIMRTGAASVLLDATLPEERLRTIAGQVNPRYIISQERSSSAAAKLVDGPVEVVSLHWQSSIWTAPDDQRALPRVVPSSTACLIFTSGSTGTPKGAIITHQNIATVIPAHSHTFGFGASSRIYNFVSYSFDASWWDMMTAMISGACLCIPSETERQSDVIGSLNRLRATSVFFAPSLALSLDFSAATTLKILFLGGEGFHLASTAACRRQLRVFNLYGPAECCFTATYAEITDDATIEQCVGHGLVTRTWIVDPENNSRLLPFGATGELVLEGPLVGGGYYGDPERTSSAFFQDPSWLVKHTPERQGRHGRIYMTGDLVRYCTADGALQLLGRKDSQVKIRGQRVELDEVAHHVQNLLSEDGNSVEVVAEVVSPRAPHKPVLVAYIALTSPQSFNAPENEATLQSMTGKLYDRLARKLPIYMVPLFFIPMLTLPRTASEKIDRRKLRLLGARYVNEQRSDVHAAHQRRRMPGTQAEKQLQRLWASVLNVELSIIGTNSNFLQMGGDSITAMQLVGAARQQGLGISVAEVLRCPELCEQAKHVHALEPDDIAPEVAPFSLLQDSTDVRSTMRIVAEICGVATEQIEDILPCTPLQEGMLALSIQRPGDYIGRFVYELDQSTDRARLILAWKATVARVPALRTRFVDLPTQGLVQVIVSDVDDLLAESPMDTHVDALTDLCSGIGLGTSMCHAALVQDRASNTSRFILQLHHAIFDGWSLKLVLDVLQRSYDNLTIERLPDLRGFIKHLNTKDAAEAQKFWNSQFHAIQAVPFPTLPSVDYRPKGEVTIETHMRSFSWTNSISTLSIAIRVAWSLLQSQYTNSQDTVFGVVLSGRQAPVLGIERMAGPTIATVPVRFSFSREATITRLLQDAQKQAVDMIPYEQTGLQRIRTSCDEAAQACSFQTLLVIQPEDDVATPSLFLHKRSCRSEVSISTEYTRENTYCLMVICTTGQDSLRIQVCYDNMAIDKTQAWRMLRQFEHILRQLANPIKADHRVCDLEFVCDNDLQDIWAWNEAPPAAIDSECVHNMITRTASRMSDSTLAIRAWDGEMTYRELESTSTRLAHHLNSLGVGSGSIVPMCFRKSVCAPVAALAVMKAGAAGILLDATQPEQRLRKIVEQVDSSVMLCATEGRDLASRLSAPTLLAIDIAALRDLPRVERPLQDVLPWQTLYVIFTSGSTGTPKGVMVTHANWTTALTYQQRPLGFNKSCRVLDHTSYMFDAAWANILHTLTAGACLCIPREEDRLGRMNSDIARFEVNYVQLTPTVARTLDNESLLRLDTLTLLGEVLPRSDALRYTASTRVLNAYGPSECTTVSTIGYVENGFRGSPTIGRGIGICTWVVDPNDESRLAAVGTVGELWVEGPLVGIGYLRDDSKTKAAFVNDPPWLVHGRPEAGQPGRHGTLYRTGDLVQYNSNGTLQFVGRKDSQVKIRGQRIELEEIEHHVKRIVDDRLAERRMPDEGVEIVVGTAPGDVGKPKLIAFVCLETAPLLEDRELATKTVDLLCNVDRISQHLPKYMIPRYFAPVRSIPRTATGKIDRRALRILGQSCRLEHLKAVQSSQNQSYTAPSSETERLLQGLWASILSLDPQEVGADDSFVDLGGDSITAMRFTNAVKQHGMRLDMADILRHTSLRELAVLASTSSVAEAPTVHAKPFDLLGTQSGGDAIADDIQSLIPQAYGRVLDAYPVTDAQKVWLHGSTAGHALPLNYALLELPVNADVAKLETSLEAWVQHFDILRTVFVSLCGITLQAVVERITVPLEVHDTCDDVSREVDRICRDDAYKPCVDGVSVLRFILVRHLERPGRLLVRLSHALYDGFGIAYLAPALGDLYSNRNIPEPPHYVDFIQHVINHAPESYSYWRELLRGASMSVLSRGEQVVQRHDEEEQILRVETKLLSPDFSRHRGTTPATLFTAACAMMLARLTASNDVVFGRLVSGREALPSHLKLVAGPCINVIPVRLTLEDDVSPPELLRRIHEQFVAGLAHEIVGVDDLFKHCAEWPSTITDFGCVSQFQNIDEQPEVDFAGHRSFLQSYKGQAAGVIDRAPGVAVFAKSEATDLRIVLSARSSLYTQGMMHEMLKELECALLDLCPNPGRSDSCGGGPDLCSTPSTKRPSHVC